MITREKAREFLLDFCDVMVKFKDTLEANQQIFLEEAQKLADDPKLPEHMRPLFRGMMFGYTSSINTDRTIGQTIDKGIELGRKGLI